MKPETWIRVPPSPFTQNSTPWGTSAGHYGCIVPLPSTLQLDTPTYYEAVYWRDRPLQNAPIHPDLGIPFTLIPRQFIEETNPPINQLLREGNPHANAPTF